jgi:hypothetical protein
MQVLLTDSGKQYFRHADFPGRGIFEYRYCPLTAARVFTLNAQVMTIPVELSLTRVFFVVAESRLR